MNNDNNHIDITGLFPKYFSNEADASERKMIEEWLSEDKKHVAEFKEFEKLWNLTGNIDNESEIDIDKEWGFLENTIEPKTRTITLSRVLKIAASIVILIGLSYLFVKITNTEIQKAPVASLSTNTLPDGTIISLNAGSKITYSKGFGTSHRNITLKGEAYFEVLKNNEIPFIISANEANIVVTGTKFNVKAYKNTSEIKVTVTEGSVKLYEPDQPSKETIITKGETGIFNRNSKSVEKQPYENLNDIAWKTMVMDFENTNIGEVAKVIENTYHIKIIVKKEVTDCPVTIHFENKELEEVLNVLKSALDINIYRDGKKLIFGGKGC